MATVDFHQFRGCSIKRECAWKNDAYGATRAIWQHHRVTHTFTIEINIGFLFYTDVVELCHGAYFQKESKRHYRRKAPPIQDGACALNLKHDES